MSSPMIKQFEVLLEALRGENLNYNSCTSLLLRKSENLVFLAPEVQWALKVFPCLFDSRFL